MFGTVDRLRVSTFGGANDMSQMPDDPAERLRLALAGLERVQQDVETIAQLLCPVQGYCKQWEDVGKLRERVRKVWYKLSRRMGGVCSGAMPRSTYHLRQSEFV